MTEAEEAILELLQSKGAISVAIIAAALLLRGLFTRYIFKLILKLTQRTKTGLDNSLALAFQVPFRALILVIGIYLALFYYFDGAPADYINTLLRCFIIIFFAWGFYNFLGTDSLQELTKRLDLDRSILDFLAKLFRVLIVALAVIIIAQEWDYDVNGFLAGLGLGGLAIALAAKDAAANIFGGIVIVLDKPFSVGDWIHTPTVEGTVEEISFRSTKIRTFAQALVTVPNSVPANEAITNWSRMEKRRVTFHLGVNRATPREKLKSCVEKIRAMLENHPEVHKETIMVRFDQFGESSLDIFFYFFTQTTVWSEYLRVREDVNLKIMEILEEEGVSVAFPSRSLYFENSPPREEPEQPPKNTAIKNE